MEGNNQTVPEALCFVATLDRNNNTFAILAHNLARLDADTIAIEQTRKGLMTFIVTQHSHHYVKDPDHCQICEMAFRLACNDLMQLTQQPQKVAIWPPAKGGIQ